MTEPVRTRLRWTIAVVVASVVSGTALDRSDAALASPPFTFAVTVSPDGSGNSVTVSVEPRPARGPDLSEPFDLYVIQLKGFQEAIFLTASGSWSPRPTSLRQGLSMPGFAPVTARWSEGRLGSMHLFVIGARASSDPFVQSSWLFRPLLRTVAVRARLASTPDRWHACLVLWLLGVLSLVVVGVVLWLPRWRRPEPANPSGDVRTSPGT